MMRVPRPAARGLGHHEQVDMQPAVRRAAPQATDHRALAIGHDHGQRTRVERRLAFVEPDERRDDLLAHAASPASVTSYVNVIG